MFLFARAYKTRRISETLMLVTYGVCILMMLTCIMWTINNSHAWIKIGPFTIQPVEFITKNSIPYLEGNVIKYVCRHQSKNGIEDIKKAIHYLQLIAELQYAVKL